MKAIVKGTNASKRAFVTELDFQLHAPDGKNYYGTGYYMSVEINGESNLIDVRYEKTTDIKKLAERWIANYYGENAKQVTFIS